ncbi:MAG: hypothetical protein A2W26_05855 [Acidobacteria bacterium RBG_16_64_8]|nr:MAG: hypothetical protein A2W26_05855 [Acidobacteria bacterium RBG_16_64_8]
MVGQGCHLDRRLTAAADAPSPERPKTAGRRLVHGPATAVWSNPSRADILPPVTQASDIAIIGGGIVGLATALSLTERSPRARLVVLDK